MPKNHVIYILGFGDHRPYGQDKIIKIWEFFGVMPHYSPVYWDIDEPYALKQKKLEQLVDKLAKQGSVSLVGVSAGATAAMNLFVARKDKISSVVFICGKILHPERVSNYFFLKHPAFKDSVFMSAANAKDLTQEDKQKMLSMYSLVDNRVPAIASIIPGVKTKRILAFGHILAIYIAIVFYGRTITNFIKSKVK